MKGRRESRGRPALLALLVQRARLALPAQLAPLARVSRGLLARPVPRDQPALVV